MKDPCARAHVYVDDSHKQSVDAVPREPDPRENTDQDPVYAQVQNQAKRSDGIEVREVVFFVEGMPGRGPRGLLGSG